MGVKGVQTLMIAGGGTGGHIYPAIAIAREYVAHDAAHKVVFVGTEKGLEKTIVPKAGFPLEFITVAGLKGKSAFDVIKNAFRLPVGLVNAWQVVTKHRPSVVLGVGGYASGPVLLVARLRGIPTLIHEANAFPGLTNRLAAPFVTSVAVAFDEALTRMKRKDGLVTGNPIRKEFFDVNRPGQRGRILIFGGSQGSRILNEAMTGALLFLARLKDTLQIVHQTGPKDLETVKQAYAQSAFPNARVVPYLDPIVDEIGNAEVVISRAGAMTVGELSATGRAAILVPFAAATNDHQAMNARVVERAGGAVVITEKDLTPERLAAAISDIVADPEKAARMGSASKALSTPDATKKIVDLIAKIQRN